MTLDTVKSVLFILPKATAFPTLLLGGSLGCLNPTPILMLNTSPIWKDVDPSSTSKS